MSNQNLDMLTKLPEDLLIDILSRLDSKEVVQTCILSKRWRNIWAYVPSLNFDFAKFGGEEAHERFNKFVSAFLHNRDGASRVHSFKLSYFTVSINTDIYLGLLIWAWIAYAVNHEVKNLVVDIGPRYNLCMPSWLFNCVSVEYMHFNCYSVIVCDFASLPKLRYLSLHNVRTTSLQNIITGCPELETLSIHQSSFIGTDDISFPTLKSLDLEKCFLYPPSKLDLSIYAPRLKYLRFVRCSGAMTTFKDMSRVTEAFISHSDDRISYHNFDLTGISSVEYLQLTIIHWKELFKRELENGTIFNSLKRLELTFCWKSCDLGILSSFLKNCPNLRSLCLSHIQPHSHCQFSFQEYVHEGENLKETENIEDFACQHLKSIEIVEKVSCECQFAHQLEKFMLQWTKEISDILIIVSQNRTKLSLT